jgi:MoxR-like ATPase
VSDGAQILPLAEQIWDIHVDDTLRDYIVRLVQATRQHPDLMLGASPRGSLGLFKTSQALAALRGRTYVLPDDVKRLAPLALAHRCIVRPESALRGRTANLIVQEILAETPLDIGHL